MHGKPGFAMDRRVKPDGDAAKYAPNNLQRKCCVLRENL